MRPEYRTQGYQKSVTKGQPPKRFFLSTREARLGESLTQSESEKKARNCQEGWPSHHVCLRTQTGQIPPDIQGLSEMYVGSERLGWPRFQVWRRVTFTRDG